MISLGVKRRRADATRFGPHVARVLACDRDPLCVIKRDVSLC